MRRGRLLPTFRPSPRDALAAADDAVAQGLDGVFCYDHLWPMGSPERPAIAPFEVLAAVAHRHPTLTVGPLVARIGLVTEGVLLGQCRALRTVARGDVVIGLGTGDRLSRAENLAYGIGYDDPDARREALARVAATLHDEGIEVWIGGGEARTSAIAATVGARLNLWDATPEQVRRAAEDNPVTWAGPARERDGVEDEDATRDHLDAVERAGSLWAVLAPASHVGVARTAADG